MNLTTRKLKLDATSFHSETILLITTTILDVMPVMRYEDFTRLEAYDTHFGGRKQGLSMFIHCMYSRRLLKLSFNSFHDTVCGLLAAIQLVGLLSRTSVALMFVFDSLNVYQLLLFSPKDATAARRTITTSSFSIHFARNPAILYAIDHHNLRGAQGFAHDRAIWYAFDHLRFDGAFCSWFYGSLVCARFSSSGGAPSFASLSACSR
jgi:hypothetical protein